jgi:hypothetical protein
MEAYTFNVMFVTVIYIDYYVTSPHKYRQKIYCEIIKGILHNYKSKEHERKKKCACPL